MSDPSENRSVSQIGSSGDHARPGEPGYCPPIDISKIARAFSLVTLSSYFLLVTGIYGTLDVLIGAVKGARSLSTEAALLPFLVGHLYCGWVGWKSVGVIGVVRAGRKASAILVLAAISCLGAATNFSDLSKPSEKETAFFEVAIESFIAATCFASLLALVYLRSAAIPRLDLRLATFLKEPFLNRPKSGPKLPPTAPWKGRAYLTFGVLWLAAFSLIPDRAFFQNSAGTRLLQLGSIGFLLLVYAKQFFQPDFNTVISNDKRPPVIFLRSFGDEERLDAKSLKNADTTLFGFTLESRLADHLSRFGPFIAVGSPTDKSPHLGATRATLSDAEWQDVVTRWIGESSLVVFMAGVTEWASWELNKVLELGHTGKMLMIFPPIKMTSWWKLWEVWRVDPGTEVRLIRIQGAFAGTRWASAMSKLSKPATIRSLVFDGGGGVTAVTSGPRNLDSHHLGALIGHYLLINGDRDDAPVNAQPVNFKPRLGAVLTGTLAVALSAWFFFETWAAVISNRPAKLSPLPEDVEMTSTGALHVGNFNYFDSHDAARKSSVFHPGDTISFAYEVAGFRLGSTDEADVNSETTLLDASGRARIEPSQARFHDVLSSSSNPIRFTFRFTLSEQAQSGDYRFDIKLHDAVSGADFEFRPKMRIEMAPK